MLSSDFWCHIRLFANQYTRHATRQGPNQKQGLKKLPTTRTSDRHAGVALGGLVAAKKEKEIFDECMHV